MSLATCVIELFAKSADFVVRSYTPVFDIIAFDSSIGTDLVASDTEIFSRSPAVNLLTDNTVSVPRSINS